MKQFSESYKKELISRALDLLVKAGEYRFVLNEDLESIKNYYYHAWDNISKEHLNAVVEAIEDDFKDELAKDDKYFWTNDSLWEIVKNAIDSVLTKIINYEYVEDNMWSKKVSSPHEYYVHILRGALENKIDYSIEETIDKDNSYFILDVNYCDDYNQYYPQFFGCFDVIDGLCGKNKIITDIVSSYNNQLKQGFYVYNDDFKDINPHNNNNNEISNLIMQLLERKGFDYILSKDRTDLIENTSVKDKSDLKEEIQVESLNNLNIKDLLMKLDTEIGSTINYANDEKKVLDNMNRANLLLNKIIDTLGIEF